jgi:hypothetical protein
LQLLSGLLPALGNLIHVRHLLATASMEQQELLAATETLLKRMRQLSQQAEQARTGSVLPTQGPKAEVSEFLRNYAGPKNSFFLQATAVVGHSRHQLMELCSILESFREYLNAGLHAGLSPERRAQLDVVSDLLDQAGRLLDSKDVHPAAPAVLIGATLEEFLRTWVDAEGLSLGSRKPGIQAYSDALREGDLITKQDAKDLVSWAGVRNHAAHGDWAEVSDRARVQLMLEGVNLFMRKYGA